MKKSKRRKDYGNVQGQPKAPVQPIGFEMPEVSKIRKPLTREDKLMYKIWELVEEFGREEAIWHSVSPQANQENSVAGLVFPRYKLIRDGNQVILERKDG